MKQLIFLFASLFFAQTLIAQTWQTNKAKTESNGCLSYEEDANKNRIPNFSHAGYKGGGVAIPFIASKIEISPINGDNTSHIQDAIDAVSAMPLDANGFRGAVFLNEGQYEVAGQLKIQTSGVVLRGNGDGRENQEATVIYGTGNTPVQRNLITLGGGSNTQWKGEVGGTRQNITNDFVQVGSYSFDITDANNYTIGDNIIIYHPCSATWLAAIDNGGTGSDPNWNVDAYPIIYNRVITNISGNEITIDAPVYNHLDRSLSQSYIYKYDREGIITNIGFENIKVDIESLGGDDENHIWNAVQLTQIENAWVRNTTVSGFGLSGIRTSTAKNISIVNVHSLDPVAIITGGRMYNFNSYTCSNNILFDNCYARNGRHHFVSNGVGSVSGFVVLRSVSENPWAASEGHRHWTTGMLFDNLIDIGTFPAGEYVMAFYNRGDYGSGHGWSAAHSVFWNCEVDRPGQDATIVVEQPPTAQNYAIGCKGRIGTEGPFKQPNGYIEGSNNQNQLEPASLYEAQLLCRTGGVLADFEASDLTLGINEPVTFTSTSQGNINNYIWDFGNNAQTLTSQGQASQTVSYATSGTKTISLTVSNGMDSHTETKTIYIEVSDKHLFAANDNETMPENTSIETSVLDNDSYNIAKDNYARSFDGVDDKIIYETTTLLKNYPFTMAAWVKTSSSSNQTIMYLGNRFSGITGNSLSIRSGKAVLEAWIYSGSSTKENITGTTILNDGEWHHIAGVFNSEVERHLYVDGILEGTDNAKMDNITVQVLNRFSVGNRDDSSPSDWLQGDLDEIRFYENALTQYDVQSIMSGWDCSNNKKILYWNFDDQSTSIAKDEFHYFDGSISGGSSTPSSIHLQDLTLEIIETPTHGIASISNEFDITYTPQAEYVGYDSLTYQIKIGECDSSMAKIFYLIDDITGVQKISSEELTIYPNPSNGKLTIEKAYSKRYSEVKVFNSKGALIESKRLNENLQFDNLNNGIYILRFENDLGENTTKKIIISK